MPLTYEALSKCGLLLLTPIGRPRVNVVGMNEWTRAHRVSRGTFPPIKHIQYLSPSVKILKTGHGAHDGPWLGSGFFAGGYSTLLQVKQEMFSWGKMTGESLPSCEAKDGKGRGRWCGWSWSSAPDPLHPQLIPNVLMTLEEDVNLGLFGC